MNKKNLQLFLTITYCGIRIIIGFYLAYLIWGIYPSL